ncbi:MAG: hypothetical protein B5766_12915 [Candidatus Lumbricidophila eiseniae]|uniref:Prohead serine protease domain-containing protein n=1 Tax=Candidatus Lumbricidiphila eiseniae TaxID=1969409 RepID=A0A2A6FN82_9MICO|nr:MAG: hypothetical protein B5766_12915 [Candidatus Lumbricidophila eiseniae]
MSVDVAALLAAHPTREVAIRSADPARREIVGIAVPWGQRADIGGAFTEEFERGAIQNSDGALYFYRHREPIGRVISHRDTDQGWEITAVISATTAGDDALALARDGVLSRHSIGFRFDQYRIDESSDVPHITHTRARVDEVSLVPFPAYEGAVVTGVRETTPTPTIYERGTLMTDALPTPLSPAPPAPTPPAPAPSALSAAPPALVDVRELSAGLDQTRAHMDDLERRLVLAAAPVSPPVADTRSVGEVLQALVRGDEDTIQAYNELQARAYTGGTSADTILRPEWVGDLTRIIDEAAVLAALFSTGTLPDTGNKLEFGQLDTDTTQVTKQRAEGDNLAFGKVTLKTGFADIETFGGYTQLTRREIERSSVNQLDHSMRALAIAAGRRRNILLREFYAAQVAAQITAQNTVRIADNTRYIGWVEAIVDAAEKYTDLGLNLDALVVDKSVFKTIAGLTATDGRPLMSVAGTGTNIIGQLNLKAISGDLASVPVRLNPKQAAAGSAFINSLAIRAYNSPVTSLQDENIINLSKDFSLYFYSAFAAEIPAAIIPVVFGSQTATTS